MSNIHLWVSAQGIFFGSNQQKLALNIPYVPNQTADDLAYLWKSGSVGGQVIPDCLEIVNYWPYSYIAQGQWTEKR